MADPVLPPVHIPPDVLERERLSYHRGFKLLTAPKPWLAKLPPRLPDRPVPRMGPAGPSGHKPAYRFEGKTLVNEGLLPADGADFHAFATPWERQWSALCPGSRGKFVPVVAETELLAYLGMGTVVAHRATVTMNEMLRYGNPVIDPKTGWVDGEGVVFVGIPKRDGTTAEQSFGTPQRGYDVLTTVDGQVMAVLGSVDYEVLEDANWVLDLVLAPLLAPKMIELAYGAARLGTVLVGRAAAARAALAGATREVIDRALSRVVARNLVKEVGLDAAMAARGLRLGGYDPAMGIPRRLYDAQVAAAKKTGIIPIFRANKGEKAIRLMEKGAAPKPQAFKFKSDPDTAVLTAKTPADVRTVYQEKYYIVDQDGVARRTYMRGNQAVTEELPLRDVYWPKRPGQVIHPDGHPVVGDIDMAGAIPLKNHGQLLAEVPKDPATGDWMSPHVRRYADAVNPLMDRKRVLHGAQENFLSQKYGGLTDDVGYAVFADGRAVLLHGKAEYEKFWDAFGRQTVMGRYGRAVKPPPRTNTPNLQVVK